MKIEPAIKTTEEKKLIGKSLILSLSSYNIGDLWKGFMPRRREIKNSLTADLISMSVYKPNYFSHFDPSNTFEKWAAVEVSNFEYVPIGMETFVLPSGLYAVFSYKGLSSDHSIFEYIFKSWLPSSSYHLDDRPHFEILGEKYKNNDPNSEEEIWVHIKLK